MSTGAHGGFGNEGDPVVQEDPLDECEEARFQAGANLSEKGLSDGHRVNRLVLGNREVQRSQ